jgi:hypothetical protein
MRRACTLRYGSLYSHGVAVGRFPRNRHHLTCRHVQVESSLADPSNMIVYSRYTLMAAMQRDYQRQDTAVVGVAEVVVRILHTGRLESNSSDIVGGRPPCGLG